MRTIAERIRNKVLVTQIGQILMENVDKALKIQWTVHLKQAFLETLRYSIWHQINNQALKMWIDYKLKSYKICFK